MSHHTTVLGQLLRLVPRHEFEQLARQHHRGRRLRSIRRWDQFVALAVAQLTGRSSLRDLVANLEAQGRKLYHLGTRGVRRSSLARVNRDQPASLFEAIASRLLQRAGSKAPRHPFRFRGKLISLDASFVEMTASVFPWAKFRSTKGAIKLHVGLDHDGYLPAFVAMTDGKGYEVDWAKTLDLPPGSVVVFDRGFIEYDFFNQLSQKKIRFVTRYRKDLRFRVLKRRPVDRSRGLTSDQTIRLQGRRGLVLRRVGYRDPESGRHYHFLTNATDLAALTIAKIYRDRWKIELFFKWIKQNLKIKTFLGTSPNAVLSQIWVAVCAYLLLAYLRFQATTGWSMQQILRLLQLNLFERRTLHQLLRPPTPKPDQNQDLQLSLRIS